ncbi:MAG: hypothetical protein ACYTEQ_18970 [Planctomycetota bacterium]
MPTTRIERKGKLLGGGKNDTPFAENRAINQLKEKLNFKTNPDGVWESVGGRLAFDAGENITGATQANPCVLTITGHSLSNGDEIYVSQVPGMTQLNGNTYTVANAGANTVELSGIDSTGYTAYGGAPHTGYAYLKFADTITGVMVPPTKDPIVTLTSANNTLLVYWGGKPITNAVSNGAVTDITCTGHGFTTGQSVLVRGIKGLSTGGAAGSAQTLVGGYLTITKINDNSFSVPVNTGAVAKSYESGGTAYLGSNYDTINLTVQAYYTYDELATELQTRLNAHASISGMTVDFNSGATDKFRVTNGSGDALVLAWYHTSTTIDRTIFGYDFSKEIADTGTSDSTYTLLDSPAAKRAVATNSKLYDEDKTELQLPDATSILASSDRIAGVWHGNPPKYYFCNGRANYIKRDDRKIYRTLPGPDIIDVGGDITQTQGEDIGIAASSLGSYALRPKIYSVNNGAAGADHYNSAVATNYVPVSTGGGLLRFNYSPALPATHKVVNNLVLRLENNSGGTDFFVRIYMEIPSLNVRTLIKTVDGSEISTAAGGADYTINDIPWLLPVDYGNCNILIEPVSYSPLFTDTIYVYGDNDDDANPVTDNVSDLESLGIFVPTTLRIRGLIQTTAAFTPGAAEAVQYKVSLVNKEGYESSSSSAFSDTPGAGATVMFLIGYAPDQNIDYDYMRIYRTEAAGTTWYKLIDIPKKIVEASNQFSFGGVTFIESVTDAVLLTQTADSSPTSSTSDLLYKYAVYWNGSLFAAGVPGYEDILYWSVADQPENFDISDTGNWEPIGSQGAPITGLGAEADLLVVFKEFGFWYVTDVQGTYKPHDANDDGIGTVSPDSIVPVITDNRGTLIFFQGQNRHFYATDGVKLFRLSEGRMDVTVESINKSAIDKTAGILNTETNEIIWSICTGASTTPNTSIVYNVTSDEWHPEDANVATIWAHDRIHTDGRTLLLGADSKLLFFAREDNANLGLDITATAEDADLDYGLAEDKKSFVSSEISAYSETAGQEITVHGYLNGSDTAIRTAGKTHTLTTSPDKYRTNWKGMARTLRRKITKTDQLGWIRINRIVDEFQPQQTERKS